MLKSSKSSLFTDLPSAPPANVTASEMPLQTEAEVLGFCGDEILTGRLKEMGIHQSAKIFCCGQAPFGGPKLFRWGTTVIALRQEEASCILVKL